MNHLTSKEWFDVPGGDDDRSIAILNLSEAKNFRLLAEESFLLQGEKLEKSHSVSGKGTDNTGNTTIFDRVFPFGESCIRVLLVVLFLAGGFGFLGYRIQQIQQERNIQKEEFHMLKKIIRKCSRELQWEFPKGGVEKNESSVNPALQEYFPLSQKRSFFSNISHTWEKATILHRTIKIPARAERRWKGVRIRQGARQTEKTGRFLRPA